LQSTPSLANQKKGEVLNNSQIKEKTQTKTEQKKEKRRVSSHHLYDGE